MISGDPIGSTFNLGERPRVSESMVAFYESFIPVALKDHPAKIPLAFELLRQRDVMALERTLTEHIRPW